MYEDRIRRFKTEKGTGTEMRPEIVPGIVTGDAPVLAIFFLSLATYPEVFAKVYSAQSPPRF